MSPGSATHLHAFFSDVSKLDVSNCGDTVHQATRVNVLIQMLHPSAPVIPLRVGSSSRGHCRRYLPFEVPLGVRMVTFDSTAFSALRVFALMDRGRYAMSAFVLFLGLIPVIVNAVRVFFQLSCGQPMTILS